MPVSRIGQRALERAKSYIGTVEHPAGSNRGPRIDEWNREAGVRAGSYWCCSFVHAMFLLCGRTLPGGASVGALLDGAKQEGWVVKRPRRGDLACFEFGEGAWRYDDHIGIVDRVLALRWTGGRFTGWVQTVEGNTSAQNDPSGSQSNGGGVFVRRRWVRGIGATFVRIPG